MPANFLRLPELEKGGKRRLPTYIFIFCPDERREEGGRAEPGTRLLRERKSESASSSVCQRKERLDAGNPGCSSECR